MACTRWDHVYVARAVVRKRSRGEKEIYRGGTASSGTLFYANRVSFFLVSRRLLNEGEEELTVPATRSLHYHISDAICSTGINAHRYFLPPLPWPGILVEDDVFNDEERREFLSWFFLYSGIFLESFSFFLSFFFLYVCIYENFQFETEVKLKWYRR